MLASLKRKRLQRERTEAVSGRHLAARAFVIAIKEAEAALEALKVANDRFYRSDVQAEQLTLSDLRRARERMFSFTAAKEVVDEAPRLARMLGVHVTPTQSMPFVDFIAHTSALDLAAIGDRPANGDQP